MLSPDDIIDLTRQRDTILNQLAGLRDLRSGTLAPRYRKCGKPNCHCAREGDPGHGPQWLLTWRDGTRGRTSIIPDDAVEQTRQQVAECARARALIQDLIAVSTRLCDARLRDIKDAKKKRSSRRSRRTSAKKRLPRSSA